MTGFMRDKMNKRILDCIDYFVVGDNSQSFKGFCNDIFNSKNIYYGKQALNDALSNAGLDMDCNMNDENVQTVKNAIKENE